MISNYEGILSSLAVLSISAQDWLLSTSADGVASHPTEVFDRSLQPFRYIWTSRQLLLAFVPPSLSKEDFVHHLSMLETLSDHITDKYTFMTHANQSRLHQYFCGWLSAGSDIMDIIRRDQNMSSRVSTIGNKMTVWDCAS